MSSDLEELDRMLKVCAAIAREAGLLTLRSFRKSPRVMQHKSSPIDLVTQTDLDSEALIRQRLAQHFPDHSVLAEEGNDVDGEDLAALWIVDPLDGTTNFAHGHPLYSISMALRLEGEIVLGVVHAPALGSTWTARRGGGAYRNNIPAHVSSASTLDTAFCSTGFPYDRREAADNNLTEWSAAIRKVQALRCCGSAAIDLAFVADGTYDGYWEKRLKPWDIAAGSLMVTEAGGSATALDGEGIPPWPEVILASNGLIHEEIKKMLENDTSITV